MAGLADLLLLLLALELRTVQAAVRHTGLAVEGLHIVQAEEELHSPGVVELRIGLEVGGLHIDLVAAELHTDLAAAHHIDLEEAADMALVEEDHNLGVGAAHRTEPEEGHRLGEGVHHTVPEAAAAAGRNPVEEDNRLGAGDIVDSALSVAGTVAVEAGRILDPRLGPGTVAGVRPVVVGCSMTLEMFSGFIAGGPECEVGSCT